MGAAVPVLTAAFFAVEALPVEDAPLGFLVLAADAVLLVLVAPAFVSAAGFAAPDFTPADAVLELGFEADDAIFEEAGLLEALLVPLLASVPAVDPELFVLDVPLPAGLPLPADVVDVFFVPLLVPLSTLSLLEFCFVAIINRSFSSC